MGLKNLVIETIGLAAAIASTKDEVGKVLVANTGNDYISLYYLGVTPAGDLDGSETFCQTIAPGGVLGRYARMGDSFAVRSGDMRWRSRFGIFEHSDDDQPYKITFHNSMIEEIPEPIELQHHDAGFVWIEPNHYVSHSTPGGNRFIVKDKDRLPRFSVEVHPIDEDEL